nr:MAG TPA: hypothetical protein [Caudoviricetes sp.]
MLHSRPNTGLLSIQDLDKYLVGAPRTTWQRCKTYVQYQGR